MDTLKYLRLVLSCGRGNTWFLPLRASLSIPALLTVDSSVKWADSAGSKECALHDHVPTRLLFL